MSSLQAPRPVSLSGVRLAVKLTPHGPAHAVFVAATCTIHGPDGGGAGGSSMSDGCPVRARDMSSSGPFGPIFHGVWQSLQPIVFTRFAPRSTRVFCWSVDGVGAWPAGGATAPSRALENA